MDVDVPGGCEAELHARLFAANRAAAAYYAAQLPRSERAVNYLRARGIEAAAGSWWQPGYAPGTWTALLDAVNGKPLALGQKMPYMKSVRRESHARDQAVWRLQAADVLPG